MLSGSAHGPFAVGPSPFELGRILCVRGPLSNRLLPKEPVASVWICEIKYK